MHFLDPNPPKPKTAMNDAFEKAKEDTEKKEAKANESDTDSDKPTGRVVAFQ
jgi:hypothetical protein